MTTDIDDVIFKLEGKDVVAFFPALPAEGPYDCTCYAHIGQHSAADTLYAASLKPAKPEQFADLKSELEQVGYKMKVVRKFTRRHAAARLEALRHV